MKVAISGASGFVGKNLVKALLGQGHQVVVLTRNAPRAAAELGPGCDYLAWSDNHQLPALAKHTGINAVINLMGANIAEKPWTTDRKKELFDSRVVATKNLMDAIDAYNQGGGAIKTIVSTSAIGIYGTADESHEFNEDSEIKRDCFLSRLCASWEEAVTSKNPQGLERKVIIRTGVVLGQGGMLEKITPIFNLNIGGRLGNGKQMFSWVHINDLVQIYLRALSDESMQGPYNATAPRPVTNRIFTFALGKAMKKLAIAPVPGFVLELVLGDLSSMLLEGQKVLPKKLQGEGYQFEYEHIEKALAQVYAK
jgi:uncharacterized protein (TIGR01777 family)